MRSFPAKQRIQSLAFVTFNLCILSAAVSMSVAAITGSDAQKRYPVYGAPPGGSSDMSYMVNVIPRSPVKTYSKYPTTNYVKHTRLSGATVATTTSTRRPVTKPISKTNPVKYTVISVQSSTRNESDSVSTPTSSTPAATPADDINDYNFEDDYHEASSSSSLGGESPYEESSRRYLRKEPPFVNAPVHYWEGGRTYPSDYDEDYSESSEDVDEGYLTGLFRWASGRRPAQSRQIVFPNSFVNVLTNATFLWWPPYVTALTFITYSLVAGVTKTVIDTNNQGRKKRSIDSDSASLYSPLQWIKIAQELYEDDDIKEPDCYRRMLCEMQEKPEYAGFGSTLRKTLGFSLDLNNYIQLPTFFSGLLFDVADAVSKGTQLKDCSLEFNRCKIGIEEMMQRFSVRASDGYDYAAKEDSEESANYLENDIE